ncbi:MAG TPA: protein kinase, partial [Anaerolineae bacterium]
MNDNLTFGKLVKERRNQLDLTQAEMARRVGCATITIRKMEADSLRPSVQIAERLAMALNIPLEDRAAFVRLARASHLAEPPPIPVPPLQSEEIGLADLSGRAIRSYELGERIGQGGFGVVYRAVQSPIEREVAIKIILPHYANQPDFIRRFEAEAKTVARLEHPHIVPLYDYWREPGVAYLVMRLMRGDSLEHILRDGPLSLGETTHLLDQIGSALHTAHRLGVIHRDLKPANILLDDDGNAYLSDFGIAKNMNLEDQTQAGQLVGSPAYLAPEQILAEPIRPQTDIYCLGLVLYEMLTGHPPFAGPTP